MLPVGRQHRHVRQAISGHPPHRRDGLVTGQRGRIAYIVGVADWRADDPDGNPWAGEAINRRTYLAVSSPTHPSVGWRIGNECPAPSGWFDGSMTTPACDCPNPIAWDGTGRIKLTCGAYRATFDPVRDRPKAVP